MISSGKTEKRLVRSNVRSQRGVTLVEMMITVALSTIVVGGMSILMNSYTRSANLTKARIDSQASVRIYLDLMIKMIRQADASSVVIDQVTGQPPWSRITFTKVDGSTIVYYQSGTILYQTVNGSTKKLADNLRSLKFSYPSTDDDNLIGVTLCFEQTIYGTQTNVLHLSMEKVRLMD